MVGPGRLITDISSTYESKVFFGCMDYVPKFDTKRDMRCRKFPYVTVEGGSRLLSRSAYVTMIFLNNTISRLRFESALLKMTASGLYNNHIVISPVTLESYRAYNITQNIFYDSYK